MKNSIFISYGHGDFDQLVRRLADDIRNCGFQVFLDTDYLKLGDWEQIIDEHILASKYFLFLSSARSTSHEGYCLNELCRAGENNSVIIPIMLDDSRIPLSINKFQRLSFVNCITPEKTIIESKYKEVFLQITSILSGNYHLGYSDEETRLKQLLKPISSGDFAFRYYSSFCGRKEAFTQFERFVDSNKNFFWVYGKPGCGKTAFSSMLLWRYPELIHGVHFCKFNNSDRANPKNIITSLAYQMSQSLPEYKKKLLALMDMDSIFEKNATRIFEYLIVEPMADIKAEQPVVVIIDALDESSWRGDNEICAILQRMKERIPSWLKFVVTSRNEADIRRYLSPIATLYFLSDDETEDDLRAFYLNEFPDIPADKLDALLAKSEGSFLYANEIAKQIKEEQLGFDDINFFPVGIYGFFNDWFFRLFGNESGITITFGDVKPILEILCISKEPVSIPFLEEYLQMDEYRLKDILALISGLFPIRNQQIEPLHKSLIDWLTDDHDVAHAFYVSKRNAYKRLGEYIEGKYQEKDYDNPYVIKYFCSTLIELKNFDRLKSILNDYALQSAIIEKLEFDSGLERYLSALEILYGHKKEDCQSLFTEEAFIKIFSDNRRLLYNSGMFFNLKNIGLSIALRNDKHDWGVEGEIGKVFYYYIVEDFQQAIKKANILLSSSEEVQQNYSLQSELYNVKGLSERKLVLFDDALESFEKCIEASEYALDEIRDNSDAEFELSLAYLIISKINMHMLDFSACNKNGKKAVKVLQRKIDEMPDCDKKISNTLFLAEDYRVCANAFIMQEEYELADERLKCCEEIYKQYNNSTDRYFIRFRYTSLFLKIMQKEWDGVLEQLRELLEKEAKGKYDKGILNYYIALLVYLQKTEDAEMLNIGFQAAKQGVSIFDSIDSLLEKGECNLLANKLSRLAGTRYLDDTDDNDYIDAWIEYIEEVFERKRNE